MLLLLLLARIIVAVGTRDTCTVGRTIVDTRTHLDTRRTNCRRMRMVWIRTSRTIWRRVHSMLLLLLLRVIGGKANDHGRRPVDIVTARSILERVIRAREVSRFHDGIIRAWNSASLFSRIIRTTLVDIVWPSDVEGIL